MFFLDIKILISVGICSFVLLFFLFSILKLKRQAKSIIYKIDVALESIGECLTKNIDILDNSKDYIKDEEFSEGYDKVDFGDMNSKETYQIVDKYNSMLRDIIIDDDELNHNKDLVQLIDELNGVKSYIEGSIQYYNDNVCEYNKIFDGFVARLMKSFCGYKKFDEYSKDSMITL